MAIAAADVTLIRGDLHSVPQAIGLSKRTLATLKWNLFWAFVYNVIGIPIAAGVLYCRSASSSARSSQRARWRSAPFSLRGMRLS